MTAAGPGAERQGEGFPKALRLLRRSEFLQVQEGGQKLSAECLLALVRPNGRPYTRLGLTVSSKVGNAVVRVRLRRLLRELFRKRRGQWPAGLDVVLVVRSSGKEASFAEMSRAFDAVTRKLQRLPSAAPGGAPP